MIIYNGVRCETIEQLESLIADLSEDQKQILRNDFLNNQNPNPTQSKVLFITYLHCPLNEKPSPTIPDSWPWKVENVPANYSENRGQGWTLMTVEGYADYLNQVKPQYNAWLVQFNEEQKATESYKRFTIKERKEWADNLMQEIKLMNIDAGLNLKQSLWLHSRLRAMTFTVSSAHAQEFPPLNGMVGQTLTIDFLNLVISGDVETAYGCLVCADPDDMSEPYHCLSSDLFNFIKMRIAQYLGWV